MVVRNPLDTVKALADSLDSYRPTITAASGLDGLLRSHPAPEVALAHYWAGIYSRIRAFRQSIGARLHVVKSENLAGLLPGVELFRAFQFLNLDWTPPDPDAVPLPKNAGRQDPAATMIRNVTEATSGGLRTTTRYRASLSNSSSTKWRCRSRSREL